MNRKSSNSGSMVPSTIILIKFATETSTLDIGVGLNGSRLIDEEKVPEVESLYGNGCRDICHLYNATWNAASPDNVMETFSIDLIGPC